jgi:aspartate aminotransferase
MEGFRPHRDVDPREAPRWRPPPIADHILLAPSSIVETFRLAAEVRASGGDVIALHSAEPDLPMPRAALDACRRALEHPSAHRYTPPAGLDDLRSVAARTLGDAHGVPIDDACVVVHPGANHAMLTAATVLVTPGDEVLVPTPVWGSHVAMMRGAGAVVRELPCVASDGFLLDPDALRAAMGPRTKILCMMSPVNPTGAVYPATRLRAIASLCAERGVTILCDSVYREHCFDATFASPARAAYEAGAPFYVVDGISKAFAMTGFRVGFSLTDPTTARAAETYVANTVSCASALSQHAAVAALRQGDAELEHNRRELDDRRRVVVEGLRRVRGFAIDPVPAGGTFVFPSIAGLIGARTADGSALDDDVALSTYLTREVLVTSVPGRAFLAPGHLRLGFAAEPQARLREAIARIESAVDRLRLR